jgi:ATP-dependent exoDNAse (exonuclease V) alpha subunit
MSAVVAGPGGGAVLDGVLERVTFANPETGYTIARIAPERGGAELITAVGPLLGAQIGEFLRLRGRWSSHPRYGRQFEVHSYATVLPATAAGIQKYLGSGLIKGIGPVMAERMVAHFGTDIMHVIDDEPGRLIEVGGLGPKRTAMIAAATPPSPTASTRTSASLEPAQHLADLALRHALPPPSMPHRRIHPCRQPIAQDHRLISDSAE